MDQSMTAAARLRAMAEKATGSRWSIGTLPYEVSANGQCDTIDCSVSSSIVHCLSTTQEDDEGRVFVTDGDRKSDAALIVHLRNRAQLYADLIEAAARFRSEVWSASCTIPSYLHAALAAIDAADKEGV